MNQEKKNEPAVSVVMCTYNGSAFVEEQLQSILHQTYPLHELLIFDDASTDETVSILRNFAALHSSIKVFVNETNLGFTRNFEQAVKAASGDVIAMADQDDVWINTKLEKMINAWNPQCPLIYCDSILFAGKPPASPKSNPKFRRFEGTDAKKIFLYNTVSGHSMLIKKTFLSLVLPFNENVMFDWWMGVVAAYNGGVQYYPEPLVCQRMHEKNITVNVSEKHGKKGFRLLYKKMIITNCRKFANALNIPEEHKLFALKLSNLMEESLHKKFHLPLFRFILENREILFNYKRRKIGIFSHVKHSIFRTIT